VAENLKGMSSPMNSINFPSREITLCSHQFHSSSSLNASRQNDPLQRILPQLARYAYSRGLQSAKARCGRRDKASATIAHTGCRAATLSQSTVIHARCSHRIFPLFAPLRNRRTHTEPQHGFRIVRRSSWSFTEGSVFGMSSCFALGAV
jgi:hypothetical protein